MTFPVSFPILGHRLPAHLVMETIAYCAGFQTYLMLRRKEVDSDRAAITQIWIIAGAIVGALVGSKALAIVESFPDYWMARADPRVWIEGKTIVGGLLGGWLGVEIVKHIRGLRESTGDAYVLPLILGICIGRVGCFLTGLSDRTYGNLTKLPWGVNFGDGPRHPTQLYEILALILIGILAILRSRNAHVRGELFRFFLLLYLVFRFAVEFIKPTFKPYLGLSAIQLASAFGAVVCLWQLRRRASSGNPLGRRVRAPAIGTEP